MGFIQPGRPSKRLRTDKKLKSLAKAAYRLSRSSFPSENGKPLVPTKSILERLPQEIVLKIFLRTGLEDNNLPVANRYFYNLFKICARDGSCKNSCNYGTGIINTMIHRNYKFDLNCLLDLKFISSQVEGLDVLDNDTLTELKQTITKYQEESHVIAADILNRKFINIKNLSRIDFNGYRCLKPLTITKIQKNRVLYIQQQLLNYSKDLTSEDLGIKSQIQELISKVAKNIPLEPDQLVNFEATIMLQVEDFPSRFYNTIWTEEKFEITKEITTRFNLRFFELDRVVSKHIEKQQNVTLQSVLNIERLSRDDANYTTTEAIIAALNQEPGSINIELCRHLLAKFYNQKHEDHELWEYLAEVKRPELLALVMEYTKPPSYMIKLMS